MSLWKILQELRAKGKKEPKTGGGGTPKPPAAKGEDFSEGDFEAMGYAYGKNAPARQEQINKMREEQKKKLKKTN